MAGDAMTAHEMTSLKVGDVLTSTGVIETYPTYWVEGGARFVVVRNTLSDERNGVLSLRLAPADKAMMTHGDLTEWCDAIEVYDPHQDGSVEHEPAVDPKDRSNPGNAWSRRTLTIRPTPDALSLVERVAAVFTQKLFEDIGEDMVEVSKRNAVETSSKVCHSHDFCDANMPMLAAFEAMGLKTPLDAHEVEALGDGPTTLWNEAWSMASERWMLGALSPEAEAAPTSAP